MFDVYFKYIDGNEVLCKDIKKIEVPGNSGYAQISGDQLLSCNLRLYDTLHLYSDTSNYTVTCKGALYLEIRKR